VKVPDNRPVCILRLRTLRRIGCAPVAGKQQAGDVRGGELNSARQLSQDQSAQYGGGEKENASRSVA
jgi:hypothetical protein